jgi:uncharacterized protein (TIGR03083 family)
VETAEHILIVQREGERLAAAAEATSLEVRVPTCPDWTVRDLVRHVGGIHAWATAHVGCTRSGYFDPFEEIGGNWPTDAALVDWFRQGHAALVQALRSAPQNLECFTFLPASSPLAFWARRQAHETGIHRADAEAAGGVTAVYTPEQAVDGIEELLFGFMSRPGQQLRADQPRTLALQAADTPASWLVRISPEEPLISRDAPGGRVDCRVSATASDLFLLVWNRRTPAGLNVEGDTRLLDLWRESVFVRWS